MEYMSLLCGRTMESGICILVTEMGGALNYMI